MQTYTTPAGRKVIATKERGKRGMQLHYSLAVGDSTWRHGETMVVTYNTPVQTRDLLGGSHGVTAWRGKSATSPMGLIVQGLAAARREALAHIDSLVLPERGCDLHSLEPAVTPDVEGVPNRCQGCVERARAHVLSLTAQVG